MRSIRLASLSLAAAAAISLAGAASAWALPEFAGPFPNPFTSTSKTTHLETVSKVKITCTADTNKGEVTAPTSLTVSFKFTGCVKGTTPCNLPGIAPGEIITPTLVGRLGYINRELKEVGVDLSIPTGAPIMEFDCGAAFAMRVQGSLVGKITPVNKLVKPPSKFTLKFTQTKGIQNPLGLQGEPPDFLQSSINGGPLVQTGLGGADSLSLALPTMIIA